MLNCYSRVRLKLAANAAGNNYTVMTHLKMLAHRHLSEPCRRVVAVLTLSWFENDQPTLEKVYGIATCLSEASCGDAFTMSFQKNDPASS